MVEPVAEEGGFGRAEGRVAPSAAARAASRVRPVNRVGYGAMQLAGPNVWGLC